MDPESILNYLRAEIDDVAANPFIALHSMHEQMVASGFTSAQACRIIGCWMAEMTAKAQQPE